jgi:hemoglobin
MRIRVPAALLLLASIASTVGLGQQERPPTEKELTQKLIDLQKKVDETIVKSAFDAAALGSEIYNKGNVEGCFRLYQGALLSLQPQLHDAHRKLADSVKDKMNRATQETFLKGAFTLRSALDEIMNDIAPPTKSDYKSDTKVEQKAGGKAVLWFRLGGYSNVEKIVANILRQAAEANLFSAKKLNPMQMADFQLGLIQYISSNTGGPKLYTGKDMKTVHAGMKITDEQFDDFLSIVEKEFKKDEKIALADINELKTILESTRKDIVEVKAKK